MIESQANSKLFGLINSPNQGFSKSGPCTNIISHHPEICYECKFLGSNPDLPNQKLWWGNPSLFGQMLQMILNQGQKLSVTEKEEGSELSWKDTAGWEQEISTREWRV